MSIYGVAFNREEGQSMISNDIWSVSDAFYWPVLPVLPTPLLFPGQSVSKCWYMRLRLLRTVNEFHHHQVRLPRWIQWSSMREHHQRPLHRSNPWRRRALPEWWHLLPTHSSTLPRGLLLPLPKGNHRRVLREGPRSMFPRDCGWPTLP